MKIDPGKQHRRSIRLAGYDYCAAGSYFVTVCAAHKRCVFGKIENGALRLHPYGRIVEERWLALPEHFPHITLDEYVVMPNHFHGILIFHDVVCRDTPQACPYIRAAHSTIWRFASRIAGCGHWADEDARHARHSCPPCGAQFTASHCMATQLL